MTETRSVPPTPEPVDQAHDLDGGSVTTWEAGPFEVSATTGPGVVREGSISVDGRAVGPATARVLASVLLSAAEQVEEGSR